MAREKKSMIGFDPLAWLDKEKPEKAEGGDNNSQLLEKSQKKNTVHKKDKPKICLFGKNIDETALLKGVDLLGKKDNAVIEKMIVDVFFKHDDIKEIFESTDENILSININNALKSIIEKRDDKTGLEEALFSMAVSCQSQGVLAQHYSVATEMFLIIAKELTGRSWTKAVNGAWSELLGCIAQTICAAYKDEVVEAENIKMETAVMSDDIEPEKNTQSESDHEEDANVVDHPVLQLNCVQDISKSQALKNDMLKLINDNDEIDIDASEVERIDGSALQLLCALFNYANQNNLVINWLKPTDALKQAANVLGMQNILELS